ncbi:MAG: 50S ribosomal protein L13 [Chloroflexi bacterium]|nr:50S ribosomal protein L13 [Chloroflexota bacterium]
MPFKTFSPTPEHQQRDWWIVDAQGLTLGRLASRIAIILRGKHKATYAPHMDMGDYVIVVNAAKIHVTGDRLDSKIYYRHSGYPGGLKALTLRQMMKRSPERVIEMAVQGMLPKGPLGRQMGKKLKVYAGPDHPHEAQNPQVLEGIEA